MHCNPEGSAAHKLITTANNINVVRHTGVCVSNTLFLPHVLYTQRCVGPLCLNES